jgi:hypothetical protein
MPPSTNLIAVGVLAALILGAGYLMLQKILSKHGDDFNLWTSRLGQYNLQIVGLTFLLPTILVIAVAGGLNPEAVTALLGAIIGYIFGSSRGQESPNNSDNKPSKTSKEEEGSTTDPVHNA